MWGIQLMATHQPQVGWLMVHKCVHAHGGHFFKWELSDLPMFSGCDETPAWCRKTPTDTQTANRRPKWQEKNDSNTIISVNNFHDLSQKLEYTTCGHPFCGLKKYYDNKSYVNIRLGYRYHIYRCRSSCTGVRMFLQQPRMDKLLWIWTLLLWILMSIYHLRIYFINTVLQYRCTACLLNIEGNV